MPNETQIRGHGWTRVDMPCREPKISTIYLNIGHPWIRRGVVDTIGFSLPLPFFLSS